MSFLSNNAAAIAVGAVLSAVAWMFGGLRSDLLLPVVPWLFFILIEMLVCFPQRHAGESTYEARNRVWHSIRKDPMTWMVVGFLALLAVPFINNGLCADCDAAQIAQGVDPEPVMSFLPFCVNRLDHLNVFLWFLTALPAMLVVRHSLTPGGKRLVLEIVVWNGAVLAALGFVQHALGAPGPLWSEASGIFKKDGSQATVDVFFSTFGYTNIAGCYFMMLFCVAVALWRRTCDWLRAERAAKDISHTAARRPHAFWERHYFLIPSVLLFYAALNTLSRAAIILVTTCATIFILHAFASFLARLKHRVQRVRATAIGLFGLVVLGIIVSLLTPDGVQQEVGTLGTFEMLDRVTGRGQYHSRVATEIWKEHKLFGCGGWGYAHFSLGKLQPGEALQTVGGINVHNDCLQFLAEHGLVGFGTLVAIVVMLVWPIGRTWYRLAREARFIKPKDPLAKPVQIFVLPAGAFCLLLAAIAAIVHSFCDCPLRSPAVLALFFVMLAALPGFMSNEE